jgi:hypothetical protein
MENKYFTLREVIRWTFKTLYRKAQFFSTITLIILALSWLGTLVFGNGMCAAMAAPGSGQEFGLMEFACILQSIVYSLVHIYLVLGLIRIMLDLYDTGDSDPRRLFSRVSLIFRSLLGGLIIGFLALITTVCVVVPIGYFALRFFLLLSDDWAAWAQTVDAYRLSGVGALICFGLVFGYYVLRSIFFQCFLVEKNLSTCKALSESFQLTKGAKIKILGIYLLYALLIFFFVILYGSIAVRLSGVTFEISKSLYLMCMLTLQYMILLATVYIYRRLQGRTEHDAIVLEQQ